MSEKSTVPIRKRFTLTFDLVQSTPQYEGDSFTVMTDEECINCLRRLFDVDLRRDNPEHTGFMMDWGAPFSNMYGPEEERKYIPLDTMCDIEGISVEISS